MKLLLDENLPKRLRKDFTKEGFSTHSVQEMGWSGKKNGELLELLVDNRFDALLTGDKNLEYQQSTVPVAIIVFDVRRLVYGAIQPLVPKTIMLLRSHLQTGVYKIRA